MTVAGESEHGPTLAPATGSLGTPPGETLSWTILAAVVTALAPYEQGSVVAFGPEPVRPRTERDLQRQLPLTTEHRQLHDVSDGPLGIEIAAQVIHRKQAPAINAGHDVAGA